MRWLLILLFILLAATALAGTQAPTHGISQYGALKYAADFQQLDYVNPNAPKGGHVRFASPGAGSFDSLNPFIIKGQSAVGLSATFATLLEGTADEPASAYGLAAESVSVAPDRSSVTFVLRPAITFHNGTPITAADVVFSFNTLRDKGAPFYRTFYRGVAQAVAVDARTVRFDLAEKDNRELPLILGQLPIVSAEFFRTHDITQTTLQPILGSGPYRVKSVDAGRSITYERVADWWGNNLPIQRGRNNFNAITYEYFRDRTVEFEAFLAGKTDFRLEYIARNWAEGYNVPAVRDGRIHRTEIKLQNPTNVQGFVFNLRRNLFTDRRVREALILAFDFEWANKHLAFDAYARSRSYFNRSPLEATGLPSAAELKLLEPLRDYLPPEVFSAAYQPPSTDGTGNNRTNLRRALELLKEAGWQLTNGKLTNASGQKFTFEIVDDQGGLERWILPWLRNLERIGIKATYRLVDSAQMQNRLNDFDFDVTPLVFGSSLTPGNEQLEFWGSDKASIKGSRNMAGVQNKAIDALAGALTQAQTYDDLITAARAFDRTLMWGMYMVPNWFSPTERIAFTSKLRRPPTTPPYGLALDTWWVEE